MAINMMNQLFLLWLFLLLVQVQGLTGGEAKIVDYDDNECKPTRCSDEGPFIRFPFWLKGHQPNHCGYPSPGFDLFCSQSNQTMLQLPFSVSVLVKEINYASQFLLIQDPDNCFMRLLPNLSLSASPFQFSTGVQVLTPSFIRFMSITSSLSWVGKPVVPETKVQEIKLLDASEDAYGGVIVDMKEPMDSEDFASLLRASTSQWRQQGKKGVWIKLPIELVNLVEPAVKEGFKYHHAEPSYLMLVKWIPKTGNTLPAYASHRVGIGAFVMNNMGEVLVVQENSGKFKGSGVWKFPTGVVDEGEDICVAAMREVKEEAAIETEFMEVLAFRQSHKSFFGKSDLFFVCMLRPVSFDIQKQNSEIAAAKWMTLEEYAAQPFVQKHAQFNYIANICLEKKNNNYTGFSAVRATTGFSTKKSYIYFNDKDLKQ